MKQVRGALGVLFLLLAVITPSVANAHEGNPNYRSEITAILPASAAEGLQATIQNFDDNIELVNRTGKDIEILGYDEEPYIRISADGVVEVNLNSPSYYLNEDRFAEVDLPQRADAKAAPEWEEVDDSGIYSWHDHRSHYMSEGTPKQVTDESKETKVFDYTIPLRVDGEPVEMKGTLTWVGKDSGFPILPFIVLAVVIVLGAVALSVIRGRREDSDDDADGGEGGQEASDRKSGPKDQAEAW